LQQRLKLEAQDAAFLIRRYRRPQPRLALAGALRAAANATMDISDGIVKDLGRLCRASGCGARVASTDLPLSPAARAAVNADPALFLSIVSAGDDYEVLATVPPDRAADFERLALASRETVTCIGSTTPGGTLEVLDPNGQVVDFPKTGYDHF
jgi:thiamine-monophosphate kinase